MAASSTNDEPLNEPESGRNGSSRVSSASWPVAGGKMGALVRERDWSDTPLGPIDTWPQSLKTVVDICLGSNAPIGIYWGSDLVLIYNDAWRPLVGDGHPSALGRPAREVFPDIWDAVEPMFARVLATGEATGTEHLRNGKVSTKGPPFTYALSPIRGSDGAVAGIFNVVNNVAERLEAEEVLRKNEEKYRTLFESMDEGFAVIEMIFDDRNRPVDYRFLDINPAMERHTGLNNPVGRTARELVPELEEHWFEVYGRVAQTGEPERFIHEAEQMGGRWFDVYAYRIGEPYERKVALLFKDITERKQAQEERERLLREAEAERERLAEVFRQAPSFMCILRGPDHVFERANDLYHQLVGNREILGKPVREALPDVEGQGFFDVLDRVYQAGETHVATDSLVMLKRQPDRPPEARYLNFVYQPIRDSDGSITGVFVQGVDLTDRKKAERALAKVTAESERQRRLYEAIISSTPDLVYVFDLDYRFTFVNDALLKMWGRTLEDSIGKNLLEVGYEPWHAEMHEREIDQVVATKQSIRGEVAFPHATLGERIYDYIFVPVVNAEGTVEAVAGTTRDVTERKQMEEALRTSEHRFRSLVEQAPIAIQIFSPDGALISANAAWSTLWNADRSHLEGYNILQDPQLEAKGIMPEIEQAFAGEPVVIPSVYYDPAEIGKPGRPRWLDATAYPVRNDDGQPREVILILRDITDRRRAEEALRESEERYRRLVGILPAGVYTCDSPSGKITFFNDHAAELWGRAPELGDTDECFCGSFKLWLPDGQALPHDETPMAVAIREGSSFRNQEVVIERPDGSRITVLANIDPIHDNRGEVVGAINVFRDTSALKRAQEALKDLNETLEDRVRERTEQVHELASTLTMAEQEERRRISQILHDNLQQLLYGIQLKMSFVQRSAGTGEDDGFRKHVQDATARLEDAIETTRQLTVDLSPPVLRGEGLTDTLQWLQSQMRDLHTLEVAIEAEHAFRIPNEDMRVLLFQIVRELLFNVVKHAETDSATVELFEDDEHLVIRVTDDGRGFDVSAAEAAHAGAGGFGLFSVRERLALFGGHMEVVSKPGAGTRVTVYTTVRPET